MQAIRTLGEHHEQVEAEIAQDASDSALGLNIDNLVNSSRFQTDCWSGSGCYRVPVRVQRTSSQILRRVAMTQMVLSAVSRDVRMSGFGSRRDGAAPREASSSEEDAISSEEDAASSDHADEPGAVARESAEGR